MKGYSRPERTVSLCGLCCALCPIHQMENGCPGCGGGDGQQSCAICRCALAQGEPSYCMACGEYPCERLAHFDDFDSFVPHRQRETFARMQAIGAKAFCAEVREKEAFLRVLLDGYNDGRRKSLFCTAVNLLPLDAVHCVRAALPASPETLPLKERGALAAFLLRQEAETLGISLKLRKKPKG